MGKKADALKLEITHLEDAWEEVMDGLEYAYGLLSVAKRKEFLANGNSNATAELVARLAEAEAERAAQPSHGDKGE